jgi:hypothetical protein
MRHQCGHRHGRECTARGAAEHEFAQSRMAVAAHDDKVGADVRGMRQDGIGQVEIDGRDPLQLDLEAMTGEVVRDVSAPTALASAMIPIVIAVLQGVATPGINVVGMTMVLQFVVSFGFILVVNAPPNMVAYGTETFAARDFVRTGLVLTVIAFALVMLLSATYWHWLGYV